MNDIRVSKNFKLKEFECKCCKQVKLDERLLSALQAMRDEVGKPIFINSGYRCIKHNKAVGGTAKSRHLFGDAADIKISGLSIQEQEKICKKYFDGVGSYGTFTHVDKRGWEARW
jgi:uncharacterized protein YcbK (DUF882 family)